MLSSLFFLHEPPDSSLLYVGVYNPLWVFISVFIAIVTSYAALNASDRIGRLHNASSKLTWSLISALTLGVGAWAMHFIGMLAFSLPCGVSFDPLVTLISMIPGILASAVALGVVRHHGRNHLSPAISGILLGAGIGTMHYTGMAAMRLDGFIRYDPFLFFLSILLAVSLAYLALRLKNSIARLNRGHNILIAVILGCAVSGMHYTAMSAAYFVRGDVAKLPSTLFTSNNLAILIALASIFLAMGALALAAISRNREMTDQLRIAATAFESHDGIMITDEKRVILRVNRAFTDITGYTDEEIIGQNPRILASGNQDAGFYAQMWESININGTWAGEIWNRRKNGEIYPEFLTITAVKDLDGIVRNYVATLTDFTSRKAAADEINNLAYYDPLTQLPNRRLMRDRLEHALASSARNGRMGALLFLDMDNFKSINDTLGHDMGDLLLQQIAHLLKSCLREGDTVSRQGGDEFVVILKDLSEQLIEAVNQTKAIGEKIAAVINRRYRLGIHECHSTTSIGATLFSGHQQPIDELIKQSDIAMFQAKKDGSNTLRFFDPEMQKSINARATIEGDLRKALELQQFQLYYQIQIDDNRRILGAEALIRWLHPERGMVPPADFIPLAEETRLILSIGQWVLETACAQIKKWQTDALACDLVLAVNISAQQFSQVDFVAQVKAIVQHYDIEPGRLKLELTESMLLANIEDIISIMNALREFGVQFSLDDFGTGYSSLQYLKKLPLNQIKIDRSFVRDLATDDNDKAIVRTIIAMAHSLKLDVIAEGVEMEEQRQFLLDSGCTHYQGYLFGRPMPIEQFEALLKQG